MVNIIIQNQILYMVFYHMSNLCIIIDQSRHIQHTFHCGKVKDAGIKMPFLWAIICYKYTSTQVTQSQRSLPCWIMLHKPHDTIIDSPD